MANRNDPILLHDRAILTLSGPDRKNLLQGLITNNIEKLSKNSALYAALLTPQGKYLHDFFICEVDETLYLDCERDRLADLFRRLMMYRLRADVTITDCSAKYSILAEASVPADEAIYFSDPRHPGMGFRVIRLKTADTSPGPADDRYDDLRLGLGLPDGSRDFNVDKTLILEGNMEELNGVDFDKGCYVGQEVTARMKHRTSLKKRLLPLTVKGPLPERGTEIFNQNGRKIGDLRSGLNDKAIGYFRLEHMEFNTSYTCGDAFVTPWRPDWYKNNES